MEDICIVCAEPLQWTAYGPCGHKDACSKCVLRLRSVLKDQRCVYCQVPADAVFATRFMGGYTETVPPDEFDALPGRAKRGELKYLDSAQAYFDDSGHYGDISALCSYTHPRVWQDSPPDAPHKSFSTLKALKAYLQQQHRLQFCDICLEGRKVFVAEQQLYTKAELERHCRGGDTEGPMALAGFKGHPECRFCRKRYYGENELYQHMHADHEQCFLCRRANPHKYVYYRDYADLEDHFQRDHHLCPHPACLEKKFVVFASEQELKTHTAREHGETLTKLEKKAALTLQMNFQYRRDEAGGDGGRGGRRGGAGASSSSAATEPPHPLAAVLGGERRAVVIGGAASVPSQFQQRGRGGSRGNLQEALAASVETAQVESAMRASQQQASAAGGPAAASSATQQQQEGPLLSEADFPSVGGSSSAAAAGGGGGRWAGAATGGVGGAAGLSVEDFPALPGTSKSAKRRAAKKKSLAAVLGGGGEVRLLNAAQGGGRPPLPTAAEHFPALSHSASAPSLAAGAGGSGAAGPSQPLQDESGTVSGGSSTAGSRPGSAAGGGFVQLQRDDWESVLPKASRRQGSAGSTAAGSGDGGSSTPLPRPPSTQEIAGPPAGRDSAEEEAQQARLQARKARRQQQQQQQGVPPSASGGSNSLLPGAPSPAQAASLAAAAPAAPAAAAPAPAPGPGAPAGISEALREANRLLIEKIRSQLDAAQFQQFRQQSASWVRGQASSQQYHEAVAELGLVSLIPDLAATCPDATKRAELLAVHRDAFTPDGKSKGKGRWVPPEVAAVAARLAEQNASWHCGACTLVNAPSARVCEACGSTRPSPADATNQWKQQQQQQQQQSRPGSGSAAVPPRAASPMPAPAPASNGSGWAAAARPAPAPAATPASAAGRVAGAAAAAPAPSADAFPALPAAAAPPRGQGSGSGGGNASGASAAGGGKKGKKGKQSLTDFYQATRVHPQNAWKNPNLKGQWAKGGLAAEERALLDAYGRGAK